MNRFHQELLDKIRQESKQNTGNDDKAYSLSNPQLRGIAKAWLKNTNLEKQQFIELLDSLYENAESSCEKYLAGFLIEYSSDLRKHISPIRLKKWLDNLSGWAQVDSLCQSKFAAPDLLQDWSGWKKLIKKLNQSDNINKRRASLVLLTKPVRDRADKRLSRLAVENIENLKSENNKLITKAISWLLREMIKKQRRLVVDYLSENDSSLPAVAVRETKNKLETGKK